MKERIIFASRLRIIVYWVCTALVAFQLELGGIGDILRPLYLDVGVIHLGFTGFLFISWIFRPPSRYF